VGVVYAETPSDGGAPAMKQFNSGNCRPQEFKLVFPAHTEHPVPSFSGQDPECHFKGEGLFYGMGLVNPKNAEDVVYVSGTLHKRQDCVAVGEGW